ncbi:hypothetical protein BJ165DRAFT_1303435, partial [Panaeolus papilionaceus]
CPVANTYIAQGRVMKNLKGRLVLPSGDYIPKEIPGATLCERFDEWHHRNPNQTAATGAMLQEVFPYLPLPQHSPVVLIRASAFTMEDRLILMEAELTALNQGVEDTDSDSPNRVPTPSVPFTPPRTPADRTIKPIRQEAPEHPFRNAKDAAYAPPRDRNFAAVPKPIPASKKADPAYRTLPPIHKPEIASKV